MELTNLYDQARILVKAGALHELKSMIDRHQQLVALRDIPDNRGMQNTLLHEATGMGELDWPETASEIASLLIECGSEVDATEQEGQGETPLHHAVSVNNVEVAEVLLKKGADPEKTGRFDGTIDTALGYALFYGTDSRLKQFFRNCPELLIDFGARVYLPFAAALNQLADLTRFVAAKGQLQPGSGKADDATTIQQAFLFACRYGHVEAADFLLEKGADINAKIPFFTHQATGLHLACENNNQVSMVRFLLEKGANPKIKDDVYNANAEGWAMFCGQDKVYKALRQFKKSRKS
jgi:ankyrin repeat protein